MNAAVHQNQQQSRNICNKTNEIHDEIVRTFNSGKACCYSDKLSSRLLSSTLYRLRVPPKMNF
jgi:hypothetical protein